VTPWLMLLGVLAQSPTLSVQAMASEGRASVSFESPVALRAVDVERAGDELLVKVEGAFTGAQPGVPAGSLIRSLTVGHDGDQVVARIAVSAGALYAIRRDSRSMTILLEAPAAAAPAPPADAGSAPTAELYQSIFPVSRAAVTAVAELGGASAAAADAKAPVVAEGAPGQGLMLGRLTLRPLLTAGYVNTEYVPPAGAAAQREQFFQIQPRIEASAPVGAGSARLGYEPRFRAGSVVSSIRKTSHLADAALDLPLGSRTNVGLSENFSYGLLETNLVDPGREYFYDLATFTSHQLGSKLRFDVGANLSIGLAAQAGRVRFDRTAGFFDYDSRGVSGDLGREITPNLRVALGAAYNEIDAPTRPQASMRSGSAQLQLNGDLAPLTRGSISLGWTRQENPQAPVGARRFDGLTANANIRKDLGYSSSVTLTAVRSTHPSAYGTDGFYVTTAGQLELTLPLPFAVSFQGGSGYHVNQYRVVTGDAGQPRKDQITYWSVGLGRAVGRWGFWRMDYRGERRNSNLDAFDNTVNTFTVRVGVGYFQEAAQP
jgi:hypothetical protein